MAADSSFVALAPNAAILSIVSCHCARVRRVARALSGVWQTPQTFRNVSAALTDDGSWAPDTTNAARNRITPAKPPGALRLPAIAMFGSSPVQSSYYIPRARG